jgi:hypothetical protein
MGSHFPYRFEVSAQEWEIQMEWAGSASQPVI